MLKSQDIVILTKAVLSRQRSGWTYRQLARELDMSASSVHDGIKRANACHLFDKDKRRVLRRNLLEFLEHGVRYAFPARRGSVSRGIPTGHAAPPLRSQIRSDQPPVRVLGTQSGSPQGQTRSSESLPPVWPHARGKVEGYSLSPLHPTVPEAALHDEEFYELLALVDAIRDGRAREREIASNLLRDRIKNL